LRSASHYGDNAGNVSTVEEVKQQTAGLKKELSLSNLVLTQVLYITGLSWLGIAAKLGSRHVFFWIPAAIFFYVPSAVVVIHLSREMPLEGGLYQWAKLRWGEMMGFLVAWNASPFGARAHQREQPRLCDRPERRVARREQSIGSRRVDSDGARPRVRRGAGARDRQTAP
jgi:hypothetical protein